mmetsp:Transcript_4935/g.10615  ORF Transcript_4935/g.10615 Transcript_4935/m.10615 type:complete len:390 (+) Transcript_4935:23-1192(+)
MHRCVSYQAKSLSAHNISAGPLPSSWGQPCSLLKSSVHRRISAASVATYEVTAQDTSSKPLFEVLYQDEHIVAIDKPAGYYVHPPEDGYPCPINENAMYLLKQQLGGAYLYPAHRLDRATSGVVVYCLSREAASGMGAAARERRVDKTYFAVCRGYTDTAGVIELPMDNVACSTSYETLARVKLPLQVGKFRTARYSLLKLKPITGRFHQIRRHMARISRPVLGDTDHGDRAHNRLFSGPPLNSPGLMLKCVVMAFDHPVHGACQPLVIRARRWEPRWHLAFDMFGASALLDDVPAQGRLGQQPQPDTADSLLWRHALTVHTAGRPDMASSMPSDEEGSGGAAGPLRLPEFGLGWGFSEQVPCQGVLPHMEVLTGQVHQARRLPAAPSA